MQNKIGKTIFRKKEWSIFYSDHFNTRVEDREIGLDRALDLLPALIEDVLFGDIPMAEYILDRMKYTDAHSRENRVQIRDFQNEVCFILALEPWNRSIIGVTAMRMRKNEYVNRKTQLIVLDLSAAVERDGETISSLRMFGRNRETGRFEQLSRTEIDSSALVFPESDYE